MKLTVSKRGDGTIDAVYIALSGRMVVAKTKEIIPSILLIDYDSNKSAMGVEIISPDYGSSCTTIGRPKRWQP